MNNMYSALGTDPTKALKTLFPYCSATALHLCSTEFIIFLQNVSEVTTNLGR